MAPARVGRRPHRLSTSVARFNSTGEVACWGPDDFGWAGELGDSLETPTIVKNVGDALSVWLPGPASIQQTGPHCVIHAGGAVSCTGENEYGNIDLDIPHDLKNGEMKTIAGVADAVQVVGTLAATCALRANGQVMCWGTNANGAMGTGSFEQPDEKVATVAGLEGALHLAAGRLHICAALGSGGVACWGSNGAGQLGDGTTEDRSAPVHVLGLP
jgi:alpha-tubulin suppressor-like RCC1 family protein